MNACEMNRPYGDLDYKAECTPSCRFETPGSGHMTEKRSATANGDGRRLGKHVNNIIKQLVVIRTFR
jgi:hypothetical protein